MKTVQLGGKRKILISVLLITAITLCTLAFTLNKPQTTLAMEMKLRTYEALNQNEPMTMQDLEDLSKIRTWALPIIEGTLKSQKRDLSAEELQKVLEATATTLQNTVAAGNIEMNPDGTLTDLSKSYVSNAVANAIAYALPEIDLQSTVDGSTTQYKQILDMQKVLLTLKEDNETLSKSVSNVNNMYQEFSTSSGDNIHIVDSALRDKMDALYTELQAQISYNKDTGKKLTKDVTDIQDIIDDLLLTQQKAALQIESAQKDITNLFNTTDELSRSDTEIQTKVEQLGNEVTVANNAVISSQKTIEELIGTNVQTLTTEQTQVRQELINTITETQRLLQNSIDSGITEVGNKLQNNIASVKKDADTSDSKTSENLNNLNKELSAEINKTRNEMTVNLSQNVNNIITNLTNTRSELQTTINQNYEEITANLNRTDEKLSSQQAADKEELTNKQNADKEELTNKQNADKEELTNKQNADKEELTNKQTADKAELTTLINNVNTELQNQITKNLNDLTDTINAKCTTLENKMDANDRETKKIIADSKTELNNKIDSTNTTLTDKINANDEKTTKALDKLNKDLTSTISTVKTDLTSKINSEVTTLNGTITALATKLQRINGELASAIEAEKNARTEENTKIRGEMTTQINSVNNTITNLKAGYDTSISSMQSAISGNQADISSLSSRVNAFISSADGHFKVDMVPGFTIARGAWKVSGSNATYSYTHEYLKSTSVVEVDYASQYDLSPSYSVNDAAGSITITIPASQVADITVADIMCYHIFQDDQPASAAVEMTGLPADSAEEEEDEPVSTTKSEDVTIPGHDADADAEDKYSAMEGN